MQATRDASTGSPSAPERERRRTGRIKCDLLECSFGEVTDLSAAGMRVRRKCRLNRNRRLSGDVEVVLFHPRGDLPLKSRVCWVRGTGFRRQEMGLQFLDISPRFQAALAVIARYAVCRLAIASPCS